MTVEPLFLAPHFTQQPWGGDALARLYHKNIPGHPTGESWEASVYPDALSRVAHGSHAGRTLVRMAELWGKDLLGRQKAFSLLIKLIDARERLSVQVHPDDAFAASRGLPNGKSEAWVVLNADADARIGLGVTTDGETFARLAREGDVSSALAWVPVAPGDAFYIPAGMVHMLGPATLVYEVQQSSDATYRLFDWDRGRELHLEDGCAAMNLALLGRRAEPEALESEGLVLEHLVACDAFTLDRLTLSAPISLQSDAARYAVVTTLDRIAITWDDRREVAQVGESFIIPAALGEWGIQPLDEGATLLCAAPAS